MKLFGSLMEQKSPVALFLIALAFAASGWFLYNTREIWGYVFVAMGIAYLLSGTVDKISSGGINREVASIIVFFTLVGLVTMVFVLLIPPVKYQISNLDNDLPQLVVTAQKHFDNITGWLQRSDMPDGVKNLPTRFWANFEIYGGNILKKVADSVLNLRSGLNAFIIIPMGTFYFLKDAPKFRKVFLNMFSSTRQKHVEDLLREIDIAFGGFIRSRLKLCFVVGVGMIIGLMLFKVKYAIVLGLFAGFCEFVPYVGPLVGAVPTLIVGVIYGKTAAVVCIVIAVQLLENAVFVPKVMGNEMGLHPMVVLLALLAGGQIAGAGGMVISVPLVAAVKIIGKYYLARAREEEESAGKADADMETVADS